MRSLIGISNYFRQFVEIRQLHCSQPLINLTNKQRPFLKFSSWLSSTKQCLPKIQIDLSSKVYRKHDGQFNITPMGSYNTYNLRRCSNEKEQGIINASRLELSHPSNPRNELNTLNLDLYVTIGLGLQRLHMEYISFSVDPILQTLWFLSGFPW